MVNYSLMQKLQQLADAKPGDEMPMFLKTVNSWDNWGERLSDMAREAIAEIERLKRNCGEA